jgi:NADH:ubiquinone oxidoreductase subunit F (NADH-binding)/NADH:ubiquinone oxidoreductase subunit E
MISMQDIDRVIENRGHSQEHLMFILRDLETLSGNNQLDGTALEAVAERMNIPKSAVAGFLSFYSMFSTEPRTRYVIRVCKSGPCHVMGGRTVMEAIERHLGIRMGEATPDGMFFLEATECLGLCSVAPNMMVNYDVHGHLTEERIARILDGYREREDGSGGTSGPETEGRACIVEDKGVVKRLLAGVGSVDPSSLASYVGHGGYGALRKAITDFTPAGVIDLVKGSGLRGRGGAGFPAGLKWSFVPGTAGQKYVVCNADEGEPGTFKDRVLMEENPHAVLEGMAICGYAIGATVGYLYMRGEYRRSIERLARAFDDARAGGFLGKDIAGSGFGFDIIIKEGGGSYVCGEETSLLNSMEGRRGYPRFRPPFPAEAGFMGRPTNVNNVETYAAVPLIVEHGAEWYREVGTAGSPGTKLFCLSGKLNRTGLVEAPMGTTLYRLVHHFGRGMKDARPFKFAQVGGSAGGILGPDLLDLPLDVDQAIAAGLMLGSGAVLVCDDATCPVDFLRNVLAFFEHESCGQCVPCRVGTHQVHYLARKFAERRAVEEDIETMVQKAELMVHSLCALGQSPILPIRTMLKYFRDQFLRHCDPDYPCPECDSSIKRYYYTTL